ncbi:MAG: phosphotransferase family protein [Myxococcota bacterium]|nr:phosphotransferase family protein [Myxococcota bacterium]
MPAPRGRDYELTRKRLTEWLATKLPEASDLSVSPLSGPDATGFSSDTLLFDLDYQQGGRAEQLPLVCRLEPTGFGVFPEYDVGLQYRILSILGSTDVPVPRTWWSEPSDAVLGAPFYLMERVEGRIPGDRPPYHQDGWMTEIEPAEQAAIWWSGLETLARIHRVDWRARGLEFLASRHPGRDALARQLAEWRAYLEWAARGRPQPTCDAAMAWLEANRPDAPGDVSLCWGDSRIGNMIFRDGQCRAVLDWEMATLAPPELDLGWYLFMDRHHSEGIGAERLPGFPSREESVARYETWTGRRVADLEFYEVFAGLRFAAIMCRLAQQMVHYEVLPADSAFERDNPATHLLARILKLPAPS